MKYLVNIRLYEYEQYWKGELAAALPIRQLHFANDLALTSTCVVRMAYIYVRIQEIRYTQLKRTQSETQPFGKYTCNVTNGFHIHFQHNFFNPVTSGKYCSIWYMLI